MAEFIVSVSLIALVQGLDSAVNEAKFCKKSLQHLNENLTSTARGIKLLDETKFRSFDKDEIGAFVDFIREVTDFALNMKKRGFLAKWQLTSTRRSQIDLFWTRYFALSGRVNFVAAYVNGNEHFKVAGVVSSAKILECQVADLETVASAVRFNDPIMVAEMTTAHIQKDELMRHLDKKIAESKVMTARAQKSPSITMADVRRAPVLFEVESKEFTPALDKLHKENHRDRILGDGGFGIVYRCDWAGHDKPVAVKVVSKEQCNAEKVKSLKDEVALVLGLKSHENILKGYALFDGNKNICFVTEFMESGSLRAKLEESDFVKKTSWDDRILFAKGICEGMNWLHESDTPIVHRDLKADNILLMLDPSTKKFIPKIADFGSAVYLKESIDAVKEGSYAWFPPEAFLENKQGKEGDVYAYGIVLWELATGGRPWSGKSEKDIEEFVSKRQRPSTDGVKGHNVYLAVMTKCWDQDASKRPRFMDISFDEHAVVPSLMPPKPKERTTAPLSVTAIAKLLGDVGLEIAAMRLVDSRTLEKIPRGGDNKLKCQNRDDYINFFKNLAHEGGLRQNVFMDRGTDSKRVRWFNDNGRKVKSISVKSIPAMWSCAMYGCDPDGNLGICHVCQDRIDEIGRGLLVDDDDDDDDDSDDDNCHHGKTASANQKDFDDVIFGISQIKARPQSHNVSPNAAVATSSGFFRNSPAAASAPPKQSMASRMSTHHSSHSSHSHEDDDMDDIFNFFAGATPMMMSRAESGRNLRGFFEPPSSSFGGGGGPMLSFGGMPQSRRAPVLECTYKALASRMLANLNRNGGVQRNTIRQGYGYHIRLYDDDGDPQGTIPLEKFAEMVEDAKTGCKPNARPSQMCKNCRERCGR